MAWAIVVIHFMGVFSFVLVGFFCFGLVFGFFFFLIPVLFP